MRPAVLMAYTKTVSEVYITGVPFGVIGFIAALFMANKKMQTKAEEQAAIAESKEKAAAAAKAEGMTPSEVEKAVEMAAEAKKEELMVGGGVTAMNQELEPGMGPTEGEAVEPHHETRTGV